MINVCIFSHYQNTQDITAIDCSSSIQLYVCAIWADTDILLIVKITPRSVRNLVIFNKTTTTKVYLDGSHLAHRSDIDMDDIQNKEFLIILN